MATVPTLQLPGYAAPQTLDFSSLANLGQVYQKARAEQGVKDAFANGIPTDAASLSQLGAKVGAYNPQLALTLANLGVQAANTQYQHGRDEKNDAWRVSESERAQRNADRSFGLQADANRRANEDKFQIVKVDNPDGTTSYARVNTRGPEGPVSVGPAGAPSAPNNPFSAGGKFNSEQGKAAGFADRMLGAEGILSGIDGKAGVQDQGTKWGQAAIEGAQTPGIALIPDAVKNWAHSKEYQQYDQAKRNFINAQLRRESGAAISPTEFDSANKQYFPMPGDSKEVIAQKNANRRDAIAAMGREGGPSYRPKYKFDDSGRVVTNTPPPPQRGQLVQGYRFKGGDPADQNNWVKAQ